MINITFTYNNIVIFNSENIPTYLYVGTGKAQKKSNLFFRHKLKYDYCELGGGFVIIVNCKVTL